LLSVHHHKAERWVSLDGNASFNSGASPSQLKHQRLRAGEVIDIEAGTIHNLKNEMDDLAVIYEIQTGYCCDEDVVRL
jgi:mannose-6-phosphate isomerase-like protein (cupin superfamily)